MSGYNYVTVSGMIAPHNAAPFWGCIIVDTVSDLIVEVQDGFDPKADHVFGEECLIFAGFGDVHIHAREDSTGKQCYKETYQTAADAALHGGVVHVSAMPNTPQPVTDRQQLSWHRSRVEELDHPVVILNYTGVDLTTAPMGRQGEFAYKCFFGKSVGDLTVTFASDLERILAKYRGEYVSFHVEYEPIVQASVGGKTHSDRRPVACVNEGLRLLLPLIEKYEIKAKLCHWSTSVESFDLIQEYRDRGCDIVVEVSPLHLLFDTSMTDEDSSLWMQIQMNPAIQSPEHRLGLIDGLRSGFVDMLATDHAPHTEEEKYIAFAKFTEQFPGRTYKEIADLLCKEDPKLFEETCVENNTSGAPWLDTFAPVCAWLMEERGFKTHDIARAAAYNPGQFVNRFLSSQFPDRDFGNGFGDIAPGYVGSLTVLNRKKPTVIRREDLKTKVGWSPLEGWTMPGSVEAVFIAGVKQ